MTTSRIATAAALLLLAACSTRSPAPVAERPIAEPAPSTPSSRPATAPAQAPAGPADRVHVVQKGETLIAIALQHGLDYKELATWNGIENVNLIHTGQSLRLSAPTAAAAAPAAPSGVVATPISPTSIPVARPIDGNPVPAVGGTSPAPVDPGVKTQPRAVKLPFSDKALADLEAEAKTQSTAGESVAVPAPTPPSASDDKADKTEKPEKAERLEWAWPVKGKLLSAYSETSKGIDIAGSAGAPVLAAADGKVMYSGTGIRGYGKLVILKHNSLFLSAYAHNSAILVKEGQEVKQGQKIAEMGSTDTDQVKLHFEIRRQGKPVDPLRILPNP